MPRPRSVSDPQVFAAFSRAIGRLGPAETTLADIAREAGVTPSALVQRFGSKRGLFSAFVHQELATQPDQLAHLSASHQAPLLALLALAGSVESYSNDRGAYLRHLASFMLELAENSDIQPIVKAWAEAEHTWIVGRIREAIAEGSLKARTNPDTLGTTLQAVLQGARFQWALAGTGEEFAWTRRQMEQALKPWRPQK